MDINKYYSLIDFKTEIKYEWVQKYENNDDIIFPIKEYNEYKIEENKIKNILKEKYNDIFSFINPKSVISNNIYENKNYLEKPEIISVYNFVDNISFTIFLIIKIKEMINFNSKITIIGKNVCLMDSIIYYVKKNNIEKKKKIKKSNIKFILKNYTDNDKKVIEYIKKKRIEPIIENYFLKNKCDLFLLDFDDLVNKFNFVLKNISKNGSIIILIPNIKKKFYFDLLLLISTVFEKFFIFSDKIPNLNTIFVFHKFKNNKLEIKSEKIKIITNVNKLYEKHRNFMKNNYNEFLKFNKQTLLLYENLNNLKYINTIKLKNLVYSIDFAKKTGLEIVDWIKDNNINKIYFTESINNFYKKTDSTFIKINKNKSIILKSSLKINNDKEIKKKLLELYKLNESIYLFNERDSSLFNNIRNKINKYNKNLQRFLHKKYNININDKIVSRAWIKIYELFNKLNFFSNIEKVNSDKLKCFYICEAPGSFINSTLYYTKFNTSFSDVIWNAQSLVDGDIFDEYNFIKKNKDLWDFGKDKTGDITNKNNLLYYIKKYRGVDCIFGDCGLPWNSISSIDLGTIQFFYNLLIPRKGGNFVSKSHAPNTSLQYVSMLYILSMKYEKLYFFKSSRNFWSPEIYIVGINFLGIDLNEEKILLDIFNTKKYLIDEISKEFIENYKNIMLKIISDYNMSSNFFIYLIRNPKKYKQFNKNIKNIMDERNRKWLEKNVNHLKNIINEYNNYTKNI